MSLPKKKRKKQKTKGMDRGRMIGQARGGDTKIEHLHVAIGHVEAPLALSRFPFNRVYCVIFFPKLV